MYKLVIEDIENIVKAENYERPILSKFGVECYNQNTEKQLASTLANFDHESPEKSVNISELEDWGIDDAQWLYSIEDALICLIDNRINN